ncbi:DUF938 domain-containing protein [Skeletonema marinoi]|uniref:DUF938 domain-containing protein n=1 Tax=Skeletonema marinoi TaxID=267567 RepID=A0AAD8Y3I3_9STRA|nr:DUF938 domain-containing protein [Skeletonema marinoi]
MAKLLSSFFIVQATTSSAAAFLPKFRRLTPLPFNRMSSSSQIAAILESPSAERNKGPIYDMVLGSKVFPTLMENNDNNKIRVLELAAGCGVHSTYFASTALADGMSIEWHPSDPDLEARLSIDARVERDNLADSIRPANGWILGKAGGTACNDGHRDKGDAGANNSGVGGIEADYSQYHNYFDLVTCINMIHIAPWEATIGLMECAGKTLRKGGMLLCYGPYKIGGTAVESNLNFDRSLKSRDSRWGVRNLEDVIEVAKKEGLTFDSYIEMPANNLSVLFRKD